MAKTLHVFRSNGSWIVIREGKRAEKFGTRREAVAVAVHLAKGASAGQLVVHGKDGRIVEHRTYGLPKVQEPPQKGRFGSRRIAKAVGKVVMERLNPDPAPSRDHASAKQ